MKSLNQFVLAGALAAACMTTIANAQMPMATTAAVPADYTDAEVRKIDKDNKKITLKHGEIKNLGMPPMTMVFDVKEAAALDKVGLGDKVRFKAVNEGGKMTVVEIQPSK